MTAQGNVDGARAMLAAMEQENDSARRGISHFGAARAYVAGDFPRALAWLDRAVEDHEGHIALLHVDPGFDPLRSDPAYAAFLERRNLRFPN